MIHKKHQPCPGFTKSSIPHLIEHLCIASYLHDPDIREIALNEGHAPICGTIINDKDFGWTVEMQIKAVKSGLRIREVPVRYRIRIGVSKITGTLSGTLKAGTKIIYTIFKYLIT